MSLMHLFYAKRIDTVNLECIFRCSYHIYVGKRNIISFDKGTEFRDMFINLTAENSSGLDQTVVESHSSLVFCD